MVNPLTPPVFDSISVAGSQVNLIINGPSGPDYTLWASTNLTAGWQVLAGSNSPALPLWFTDTSATAGARFYRLEIGP